MKTLRLILGDQLSEQISSLKGCNKKNDLILMCEVINEATYVKHHKKKIAFLFSAMRHFAQELENKGYNINYYKLEDNLGLKSFTDVLNKFLSSNKLDKIVITHPSEYRVLQEINTWKNIFDVDLVVLDDDRFLCTPKEFASWSLTRKQLRMEYFYRQMREKYNILMDNNQPVGGAWNYDNENRKPAKQGLNIPKTYQTKQDTITKQVIDLVESNFSDHFGSLENFNFAVTRKQAIEALNKFIEERLVLFGDYQDAMIEGEAWMYHSHISFYLNCGLLLPMECVKAAQSAYYEKKAPINAVEGFIRQIIGWREYIRGIYWLKMPEYAESNFFNAKRALPDFYWNHQTKMNCLKQCVLETKQHAYAHHIQRLMVLGNFALLAGIDPKEVNEWFIVVYADAYEWVELPNVTGMALFADGGLLASKPYASGGSYINKMSDYCKNCQYKVSNKSGEDACPFNYLYWNFLIENKDKLSKNPRVAMMYRTLDRMDENKKINILQDSKNFLDSL